MTIIREIIDTKVSSKTVWGAWSKAHAMDDGFVPGKKAVLKTSGGSKFSYRILDVQPGSSFSIVWKSYLVRLVFTHAVTSKGKGSEIAYTVQVRGFFAWPVRRFLGKKIRKNLQDTLKCLVYQLETRN